ncbi:hypothetical protein [Deinococcus altitudinis]|uniref:hypothetical protein n=1 Tax=Deinococcus altitudinis TaxID=468914 RepID=UPI003891C29B
MVDRSRVKWQGVNRNWASRNGVKTVKAWLALLVLASGTLAGAAAPLQITPLDALNRRHLIRSAEFVLAHASYQLYRVRWLRPDLTLNALFINDAQTAAQSGQVRRIVWTVPLTPEGRLTPGSRRALLSASRATALACLNVTPAQLESRLDSVVAKGRRQQVLTLNFGSAQSYTVGPTYAGTSDTVIGSEVSIEIGLPDHQRPLCVLPD